MTVYVGSSTGNKVLVDPQVGTSTGKKAVQQIWVGTAQGNRVVYTRTPTGLSASVLSWSSIRLTITSQLGADSYVLRRGSTTIYSGPLLTYTDTGLYPLTSYTYTVDAMAGTQVLSTGTVTVSTSAVPDLGLVASPSVYDIELTWTDPGGAATSGYRLYRGATLIYAGTGKSFTSTGLAATTSYTYRLEALRGTQVLQTDTVTVSTVLRPDMGLAESNKQWDRVTLSWTDPAGAPQYVLLANNTKIYQGSAKTYTVTTLRPATSYVFKVLAVDDIGSGIYVGEDTITVLTPERLDLGLIGVAKRWDIVQLDWFDPSGGIDKYVLDNNGHVIYEGPEKTFIETGRFPSTTHKYNLRAYRGGEVMPPSDYVEVTTPARPTTQKTVTLTATDWASYNGDGTKRTDTSDLYYGQYSSVHGLQKSQWRFAIPADVRNCVSIDSFKVSMWNLHTYPSGGTPVDLVVHHNLSLATYGGSTGRVNWGQAFRPGWWNATEWTEAKNWTSAGRYTVAEEFRTHGAHGLGFVAHDGSTAQAYYGYARGSGGPPRIQITYTVYN